MVRSDGSEPPVLTWSRLLAYGGLALPLAALNLPLYVYLPTFYSTERGVDLARVGFILLVARTFDVVTDPLIGELGDRTRSRFGQRRPWVVAALPLLLLATWQLFVPDPAAGALHLLLWSVAAYLAWTMMLLAYTAWGAELSGDYHERSRVTGAREGFVIIGIMLAAAVPVLIGAQPGSGPTLQALFWLTAATLLVALVPALLIVGEPERVVPERRLPLGRGIRIVFANAPFRRLLLAYLLNGVANGLPATLFLLFVGHVLKAPGAAGPLLILYFASGVVAVPAWLRLSSRIGKHRAWSCSMLWAAFAFAWTPLLGAGDVLGFAVVCGLSGLSLGADMALPAAMQADVVDLDRVTSGRRRTGLFFAIWSMATKLALALAVGIAFPTLALLGFTPSGPNGPTALLGLTGLYALLPVLIKLGAVRLVWRFEIDAGRQAALRRRIETAASTG